MADAGELRDAVRRKYREVAERPEGRFPYAVGAEGLKARHYRPEWLEGIPGPVLGRFVGVGNPWSLGRPPRGGTVLDLGCGSGVDVLVALKLGAARALGVDLTPELLPPPPWPEGAEFREGLIERLPWPDASVDLAVSNGVLNLVPSKDDAFREIHRVLKPRGRLAAADLVLKSDVPAEVLADPDAWAG